MKSNSSKRAIQFTLDGQNNNKKINKPNFAWHTARFRILLRCNSSKSVPLCKHTHTHLSGPLISCTKETQGHHSCSLSVWLLSDIRHHEAASVETDTARISGVPHHRGVLLMQAELALRKKTKRKIETSFFMPRHRDKKPEWLFSPKKIKNGEVPEV